MARRSLKKKTALKPDRSSGFWAAASLLTLALGICPHARGDMSEDARVERVPASVESLSLAVLESFPVQVTATLAGLLPDGCSRLESIEERFDPERRSYTLAATMVRGSGTACAQTVTPFEVTVPIIKAGMATGVFAVQAHGRSADFEIVPLGAPPNTTRPGITLPGGGATSWLCMVEERLCFAGPEEWEQQGLEWDSPAYLDSEMGFRWWPEGAEDPAELLPQGAQLIEQTIARLGWGTGTRMITSREDGEVWSEHVFAPCGMSSLCEFWLESPTEPLLGASGEPFWRMVRFAARF